MAFSKLRFLEIEKRKSMFTIVIKESGLHLYQGSGQGAEVGGNRTHGTGSHRDHGISESDLVF